jgi:predicted phage-related endonuclease
MALLHPKSRAEWLELRHNNVSSTDSPSLFDVGYNTRLGLYYAKLEDKPTEIEMSERMEMGQALQRAIATVVARKYGLQVRAFNAYAVLPSRMGASFDYQIVGEDTNVRAVDDDSLRIMYHEKGPGVLEIKNVDSLVFRNEWSPLDNGGYEAPPHIEIQIQHQLHCLDRAWGAFGVCVGGNRLEVMIRNRDKFVGETIEKRVKLFWNWIENKEPPPEKMPDDFDLLKRVYGSAEPDKVMDATGNPDITRLCKVYAEAQKRIKEFEEQKKLAHADLLKLIGDNSKVLADGYTISCGVTHRDGYTVESTSYRNFRITPKKSRAAKGVEAPSNEEASHESAS